MSPTTFKIDERTAPASLSDVSAVEEWFRALLDAGINFHPEESFGEMVFFETGDKLFRPEDAARLDRMMERAYELCDPCEIAVRVFESRDVAYIVFKHELSATGDGEQFGSIRFVTKSDEAGRSATLGQPYEPPCECESPQGEPGKTCERCGRQNERFVSLAYAQAIAEQHGVDLREE